jgi:TPR repeat protein
LRQSADLGYPLAPAKMAGRTRGEEKYRFAKSAVSQRERDGFYWLRRCYERGSGCEEDLEKARECYLVAAQLGNVLSMDDLGNMLADSDPQRWFWWGLLAVRGGLWRSFLFNFSGAVEKFNISSENGAAVFQIGKALSGHVSVEKRTIFGSSYDFNNLIGPASSAILFYKSQLSACRSTRGVTLAFDVAWSKTFVF